jgi:hypothetical protein
MKKIIFLALVTITMAPLISWAIRVKKKVKSSPIVSVTMQRTACFGKCPEYSINMDNKGNVTYTGIRNAPIMGVYKKNIGYPATMNILYSLNQNQVDTCSKIYWPRIQDLPGIMYTITYKDSSKRILGAEAGPEFLRETAEVMDKLGKPTDKTWKKVKTTTKK